MVPISEIEERSNPVKNGYLHFKKMFFYLVIPY